MGETRTADPTLDGLGGGARVYLLVNEGESWGPLPVAHRPGKHAGSWWQDVEAIHARWFAVPCRECFPTAPPPGRFPCRCGQADCPGYSRATERGLSWQLGGA